MTYIEFFDKTVAENICACLANIPERVVLLGNNKKQMAKHSERYRELFEKRGHDVEFICCSVNRNRLADIVSVLSSLIEKYEDCIIDLTGGDELFLVAAGIVSERFKDKNIQMHRFNITTNFISDCDLDGITIMQNELPKMSIEENIRAYGGNVVYDSIKSGGTHIWDYDDAFKLEIDAIWNACKINPKKWNSQCSFFANAEANRLPYLDSLVCTVSLASIRNNPGNSDREIVDSLLKSGILTEYKQNGDELFIKFKNHRVKRCLMKAGQALEMKIYSVAKEVLDKEGNRVYNDVLNGVFIDWDGEIHLDPDACDVENEIDVMMMKGIIPVFVSCKNGTVEMDELYKLNSVAERFGKQYSKCVLVASYLDPSSEYAEYFLARAKEMDITVITNNQMSDEALYKRFANLWK